MPEPKQSSQSDNMSHPFDTDLVVSEVRLIIPDIYVLWVDETRSTNIKMRDLAKCGAGNWTVVVAGKQSAGKGRYQRQWASPPGGLYQSLLLRPPECESPITLLPLLAGVALKEGIEEVLARSGGGAFRGWLKWPNDLICDNGKLAGILCEATRNGDEWEIVVGVGLNVEPVDMSGIEIENRQSVTCLRDEHPGVFWTREELLISYLRKVYHWVEVWRTDPERVRQAWLDASGMEGKNVEATSMGKTISGVVQGIGENGELLIESASGLQSLNAAEALIVHDTRKY
ncbi:MAG TPA: biotin--[acetyl-CoA-carboxylase] ligase [Bacteroidetes bacterium]|nr:bifunctional ligase/repressor BirA [bacterium BMS3Bbin04]HDO64599.1 biotin--[acetyl-CoA-carboxylase] ligase [Bacteroidota bacterium]HEX03724.1 biotin--[acetyl-CoA-carboxylase] ligase [Bacteroidota bacterium]